MGASASSTRPPRRWKKLEVINQTVASIAKQEEIIYVLGQEDQPIRLERHSPILHLIQQIRDETHRFAVGFHRQRRARRTIQTGLEDIPGVGRERRRSSCGGSAAIEQLRSASIEQIARVVPPALAERVFRPPGKNAFPVPFSAPREQ